MSALEEYAVKIRTGRTGKKAWKPPEFEDLVHGWEVLSIDQSLRSSGWVYFRAWPTWIEIIDMGTIRPVSDEDEGFSQTYGLAHALRDELIKTFRRVLPDDIVFEMPTVQGNRTESSLLGGYVVRDWAFREKDIWPYMISIQHSRTVLAGPGTGNDKKAGHEALARYIPESTTRKWNEHTRDAALNGLAYLHDLREDRRERGRSTG